MATKRNGVAPWVWRSIPIDDPGDLLAALPEPTSTAWVRGGEGLIGWGEVARVELDAGADPFRHAGKVMREMLAAGEVHDMVGVPGTGPVGFASFAFDPSEAGSVVIFPQVILARRAGLSWLTTVHEGASGKDAFRMVSPDSPIGPIHWIQDGSTGDWRHAVETVLAEIRSGHVTKVVLSRGLTGSAAGVLDPRGLLRELGRRFPECYTFSCAGLVGATPELLIRRYDDRIDALVLAGSVRRGRNDDDDAALSGALRASAKDAQEHRLAVDSVVTKVVPLCTEVSAPPEPALLTLANIQHLATPISGRLAREVSALEIVRSLHPTAAVGGVPADTALRLIHGLEGTSRGRYSGPVGWFDGRGNGEWGIALRCAQIRGRRIRVRAGAGIVEGSDPAAEWEETEIKLRAVLDALAVVGGGEWVTTAAAPLLRQL
uniref:isochorismate synthase n=1 Tax=Streptomyces argenteolus TaxID=67274 RepID=A9ZNU9_9ACTN|nr:putative isochorismate synthase [Streptomyces argenteolus]